MVRFVVYVVVVTIASVLDARAGRDPYLLGFTATAVLALALVALIVGLVAPDWQMVAIGAVGVAIAAAMGALFFKLSPAESEAGPPPA